MKKIAAKETAGNAKSYFGQAYPEGYGGKFTKGYTGKTQGQSNDDDKKFQYSIPTKEYSTDGHKMNQNETDAKSQFSSVSKSWKDQEKGFLNVVESAQKIINERFARFQKALDVAGESLYKGIDSHPLKEALYTNFCEAGFDADTARYVVENSFDESAEEYHTALLKKAEEFYSLEGVEFAKKLAEISTKARVANVMLQDEIPTNLETNGAQPLDQSAQETQVTQPLSEDAVPPLAADGVGAVAPAADGVK